MRKTTVLDTASDSSGADIPVAHAADPRPGPSWHEVTASSLKASALNKQLRRDYKRGRTDYSNRNLPYSTER